MRKKYKNNKQILKENNNNENTTSTVNKLMILNDKDNENDSLKDVLKRNTISNLSNKPILYKNFRLNKKLELNNLDNTNLKIDNSTISGNNITEINKDKNYTKFFIKKNIIHEKGIIVNRPNNIRNKLYINMSETILKTNPNIQNKINNRVENSEYNNNKNTIDNQNQISINKNNNFIRNSTNNGNIKKIEVNLLKNRLKNINNSIKIEKSSEIKSPYINTDINYDENKNDLINRRESSDLLSFVRKYKINSIDKGKKIKNINIEYDNVINKERMSDNNITNKYFKTDTYTTSRNKSEKSPLKLLVHKAFKNSNMSDIFNKMYDYYFTHRSKSKISSNPKNSNRYSTIDLKSNTNDSSINEKNSDLNNISKILKEYGSEKKSKKHLQLIKYKSNKEITSPFNNDEIHSEGKENIIKDMNMENKIVNNNTFNTTFNIYKINNIISKKPLNSNIKNNIIKQSESYMPRTLTDSNNDKEKGKNNLTIENERLITSFKESYDNHRKKTNDNFNKVNIEIFYSFTTKIQEIVRKINNYEHCCNECNDFILFFFANELYESFINSFKIAINKNMIINIMKVEILCFFLYYDSSFYKNYIQAGILFKAIFNLLSKNFLIKVLYIMKNFIKIGSYNIYNTSLYNDLNKYIKKELNKLISSQEIHNENFVMNLIKQNYIQINNYYQMIINNLDIYYSSMKNIYTDMKNKDTYKFPQCLTLNSINQNDKLKSKIISNFFFDAFKSLNSYNISDLKKFYDLFLIKESIRNESNNNFKKRVINYQKYNNGYFRLLSNSTRLNKNIKNYLPPIKSIYKCSLFINLDTLIYIQNKFYKEKFSITQIRPGLIQFLKEMKQTYELILYSVKDFDYISGVFKNFEDDDNKYFENILSNFKISLNSDGSIQNLDLLGRNINNIIFIDNAKNLTKINNNDNIIYIKPYYGNVKDDKNIMYNLIDILKTIRIDLDKYDDIRIVLKRYKFIIFTKVTNILI